MYKVNFANTERPQMFKVYQNMFNIYSFSMLKSIGYGPKLHMSSTMELDHGAPEPMSLPSPPPQFRDYHGQVDFGFSWVSPKPFMTLMSI